MSGKADMEVRLVITIADANPSRANRAKLHGLPLLTRGWHVAWFGKALPNADPQPGNLLVPQIS